ncbi:MAG: hypothetical protein AB8B60_10530 [Sulfitobacter sp.]
MIDDTIEVLNVNHPDYRGRANAAKYNAMKAAMKKAMAGSDGMTQTEMREAAKPHLPQNIFPQGKTAGWWSKTVQLDLEARGEMGRTDTKPLKFFFK